MTRGGSHLKKVNFTYWLNSLLNAFIEIIKLLASWIDKGASEQKKKFHHGNHISPYFTLMVVDVLQQIFVKPIQIAMA